MALTSEQIELLNVCGPYESSAWESGDLILCHTSAYRERVLLLAETLRGMILAGREPKALGSQSVTDIGCHDGWMLEVGLAELPFQRIVGVEPREKNITKGRTVREILGLPTRADYVQGSLETLGTEQFDVVLCLGVLHHVESIPAALRALRKITGGQLCIETLVLPDGHITEQLRQDLEMKDVVYKYHDLQCGITGQRLETSYYDGSAASFGVVSLPSVESLLMHLECAGFGEIRISETYTMPPLEHRRWRSLCLSAVPTDSPDENAWIREYELGLARTILDRSLVERLYGSIGSRELESALASLPGSDDAYVTEILKNLSFSPADKITLEYGKMLLSIDPRRSIEVLEGVTLRLNADWRATYRAHHALALAHDALGEGDAARRHRDLCLMGNPRFPVG